MDTSLPSLLRAVSFIALILVPAGISSCGRMETEAPTPDQQEMARILRTTA